MRSLWAGLLAVSVAAPALGVDPLTPAGTGGIATVDRALAKLERNCRLLLVAAHPDDEDTTLLTYVGRGMGCEAAYLALTRGDGGQNLIGPELGEALGVLRTEELLAARRIDGARQYFTRAFDYGYSKTVEEAFAFWPREVLLEDTVLVARRFMPHVVVSVFPPTERAGHGQHQAAGVMAGELYEAAGDAAAVPGLDPAEHPPWTPSRFYREAWWEPEAATVTIEAGVIDPLTGKSYFQTAMESRSQHRCQSFGVLQPPGPRPIRLILERHLDAAEAEGLFGEHDTRFRSMAMLLPEGPTRSSVEERLIAIEERATALRGELSPRRLADAGPELARLLAGVQAVIASLADDESAAARQVVALLREKEAAAREALLAASGIVVDATTGVADVVAGDELEVEVALWNAGSGVVDLEASTVTIESSAGWSDPRPVTFEEAPETGTLTSGELVTQSVAVAVAADAGPTVPYILAASRQGGLYDMEAVPLDLRGEPWAPPPLAARFELVLGFDGDEPVRVEVVRPVVERQRDLALGEVRRPLRLVPRVEVAVDPGSIVRPRDRKEPSQLEIQLRLHGETPVSGTVRLDPPDGWEVEKPRPFELDPGRREAVQTWSLRAADDLPIGRQTLRVEAVTETGSSSLAVPLVDYPHIHRRPVPYEAVTELVSLDLELPRLDRVAYVRGAGDLVPEALAAVGVPVELVEPADLDADRLEGADVLVIGPRAYESSPELAGATGAIRDFLERGGTVIVQFQRWGYFEQELPPVPMTLTRRERTRTSDETAPVELLAPDHPALSVPNRIGPDDWDGWVQERSTYNPVAWGDEVTALLAMTDPGEEPADGSLLVAQVGEGTYVYAGVAFFRQLPAGVPGAFRLFANLLGL